jgi:hypothetical protein
MGRPNGRRSARLGMLLPGFGRGATESAGEGPLLRPFGRGATGPLRDGAAG